MNVGTSRLAIEDGSDWAGCAVTTTHVFVLVTHSFHVGDFAPLKHELVRVCMIEPACPAAHESVLVCGASGMQETEVVGLAGVVEAIRAVGPVDAEGVLGGIVNECVGGAVGVFTLTAHLINTARVLGPTAPYPVVAGVPEDAMLFLDCHSFKAFSVITPKKPVAPSGARRFCKMRNCWSCVTSKPREPRERLRTRFGHEVAMFCDATVACVCD
jgi:hypothetical protein